MPLPKPTWIIKSFSYDHKSGGAQGQTKGRLAAEGGTVGPQGWVGTEKAWSCTPKVYVHQVLQNNTTSSSLAPTCPLPAQSPRQHPTRHTYLTSATSHSPAWTPNANSNLPSASQLSHPHSCWPLAPHRILSNPNAHTCTLKHTHTYSLEEKHN